MIQKLKKLLKNPQAYVVAGVIVAAFFLLAVLTAEDTTGPVEDDSQIPKAQTASSLKGFSLSPRSYDSEDFGEFFEQVTDYGNTVSWTGNWEDLANESSAANVVMSLADTYDYKPLMIASGMTDRHHGGDRDLEYNEENKSEYINAIKAFVRTHQPEYFGIGVEVNRIKTEVSQKHFDQQVDLFDDTYDEIKKVSPDTQVFTVFQLENMKGLNGGLYGGKNDKTNNQWDMLRFYERADLHAFTSYPSLIYKKPTDIPDNYYSEIAQKTDKPIAFTEIGWHTDAPAAGWASTPEEQDKYVSILKFKVDNIDTRILIWSWLYDQEAPKPFNSMGMISKDGVKRPALATWRSIELPSSE